MTVDVHTDWATAAFDRPPVAEAVGPFAERAMQRTWWDARGSGELLLLESADALHPMTRVRDTIRLVGEADVFDYHSPLGEGVDKLVAMWAPALPPGISLEFDSLPADAADLLMAGLIEADFSFRQVQIEMGHESEIDRVGSRSRLGRGLHALGKGQPMGHREQGGGGDKRGKWLITGHGFLQVGRWGTAALGFFLATCSFVRRRFGNPATMSRLLLGYFGCQRREVGSRMRRPLRFVELPLRRSGAAGATYRTQLLGRQQNDLQGRPSW